MPFDPSQPFTVVEEPPAEGGFDPSKPFTVVEEPEAKFDPSKPFTVAKDQDIRPVAREWGKLPPPSPASVGPGGVALDVPGTGRTPTVGQEPMTPFQVAQPPTPLERAQSLPPMSAAEAEELAMTPQARVPEPVKKSLAKWIAETSPGLRLAGQKGEQAAEGLVNLGTGLAEFSTAPAAGPIAAAQMVPGLNVLVDAAMMAGMGKSGVQKLEQAWKTGDVKTGVEGAGEFALGVYGLKRAFAHAPKVSFKPNWEEPIAKPQLLNRSSDELAKLPPIIGERTTDASQVSPTTEIHGDVQPLKASAEALPLKEGGERVQPQAEGRLPGEDDASAKAEADKALGDLAVQTSIDKARAIVRQAFGSEEGVEIGYDDTAVKIGPDGEPMVAATFFDRNDGKIKVNAAWVENLDDPLKAKQLLEDLREEVGHRDLATPQGEEMLSDFIKKTPLTEDHLNQLKEAGYWPSEAELQNPEAYLRRMHEEFIAKQGRVPLGWFQELVDRFKIFAKNTLGLDLTQEQAARAILRKLRELDVKRKSAEGAGDVGVSSTVSRSAQEGVEASLRESDRLPSGATREALRPAPETRPISDPEEIGKRIEYLDRERERVLRETPGINPDANLPIPSHARAINELRYLDGQRDLLEEWTNTPPTRESVDQVWDRIQRQYDQLKRTAPNWRDPKANWIDTFPPNSRQSVIYQLRYLDGQIDLLDRYEAQQPSDVREALRRRPGKVEARPIEEREAERLAEMGLRVRGGIVSGAPPFIRSQQGVRAQIATTVKHAMGPEAHESDMVWYQEAGRAIRDFTHGDVNLMEKMTRIVAKLSQASGVNSNVTSVIKAAYQIAKGETPKVGRYPNKFAQEFGPAVAAPEFTDALKGVDRKLMNFYRALHDEAFQENRWPDSVVIDRHAINYIWDDPNKITVTSDAQYDYAEQVVKLATEEYNRQTGRNIKPRQMQATLWGIWKRAEGGAKSATEASAEGGSWNYPQFFERAAANVTAETVPSKSLPIGAALEKMSFEEKRAFTKEAIGVIFDEKGQNELARRAGLVLYREGEGTGGYQGQVNPNVITGAVAEKKSKLQSDPDKYHRYTYEAVNHYADGLQYIYKQDAVPWFRADVTLDPAELDAARARRDKRVAQGKKVTPAPPEVSLGFFLEFPEEITPAKEEAFFKILRQELGDDAGYTKMNNKRIAVVNYRNPATNTPWGKTDAEFEATVDKVGRASGAEGKIKYGAETRYEPHDWTADPTGEALLHKEAASLGPDWAKFLGDRRAAFEAVAAKWASRAEGARGGLGPDPHGVGPPESRQSLRPAPEWLRQKLEREGKIKPAQVTPERAPESRAPEESSVSQGIASVPPRTETTPAISEATPSPKEAQAPPVEAPKPGVTTAVPPLVEPEPMGETGIKNAETDRARVARGEEPIFGPAKESNQTTWDKVMRRIDRDPDWQDTIIRELLKNPKRQLDRDEVVALDHRYATLQNRYTESFGELRAAEKQGNVSEALGIQQRLVFLRDKLNELEHLAHQAGSVWGQSGQMRQRLIAADYSLVGIQRKMREAKAFAPLNADEMARAEKMAEQYKAAFEAEKTARLSAEQRAVEADAKRTLAEIAAEKAKAAMPSGVILETAKKILDRWEAEAKQARADLAGKFLSPTPGDLVKLAKIVRFRIGELGYDTVRITADLIRELGPKVEPYLKGAFERARKMIDQEGAGKGQAQIKAVLTKTAPTLDSVRDEIANKVAKEQMDQLNPLVRKMASILWDQGIHEMRPMVAALQDKLKDVLPGISDQDMMSILSNRGKFSLPTEDVKTRGLADIIQQARLVAHQIGVLKKEPLPRTGKQRYPISDKARREQDRLNELMRREGVVVTDPTIQLKGPLDQVKTYMRNRLADLRLEMKTRERIVKTKTELKTDAEYDALRKELDQVQAEHDQLFGKRELTDEQKIELSIKSVDRATSKLEADLKAGKLYPDKRAAGPTNAILEAKKAKLAELREVKSTLQDLDHATREQRQAMALDKQINEYDRRILERDLKTPAKGQEIYPGNEARAAKRNQLRQQLKDLRDSSPEVRAQLRDATIKKVQAQIDELARQINEGDIAKKAAKPKISDPELEALRGERDDLAKIKRELQNATKPRKTPEEIALQSYKSRLATREAQLKEMLATGNFTKKPRLPIILDKPAIEAKARVDAIKEQVDVEIEKQRLANLKLWQKSLRNFVRFERFGKLSSPLVFGKLFGAAMTRLAETATSDTLGTAFSYMPIVRTVIAQSPRYARRGNLGSIYARAAAEASTQGMKDAWTTLTTGKSNLELGHGREFLDKDWMNIAGQAHGMVKAPIKRFEYELSKARRTEFYFKNGLDVTSPEMKTRIHMEAVDDAYRSIFMQHSLFPDAINRALSALEHDARHPVGNTLITSAVRFLLPVIRVPFNIIGETATGVAGAPLASGRVLAHLIKGTLKNLPPAEADAISRQFIKGSIGLGLMAIGFYNPDLIGGYDWREKREVGAPKAGGFQLPDSLKFLRNVPVLSSALDSDGNIPRWMTHAPWFELMQFGATVRHVAMQREKGEEKGTGAGVAAASLGLIEETPLVKEMLHLDKLFNPRERDQFVGQLVSSTLYPQLLLKIAELSDREFGETIKRKPETMTDYLKLGIPGLRQDVPEAPFKP